MPDEDKTSSEESPIAEASTGNSESVEDAADAEKSEGTFPEDGDDSETLEGGPSTPGASDATGVAGQPNIGASTGSSRPRATFEALASAFGFGELVVSFRDRDVTMTLDGPTAVRAMAHFARRGNWADSIHGDSSFRSGWVVLRMEEVLAMSWNPGLDSGTPPAAFDPPTVGQLAVQYAA